MWFIFNKSLKVLGRTGHRDGSLDSVLVETNTMSMKGFYQCPDDINILVKTDDGYVCERQVTSYIERSCPNSSKMEDGKCSSTIISSPSLLCLKPHDSIHAAVTVDDENSCSFQFEAPIDVTCPPGSVWDRALHMCWMEQMMPAVPICNEGRFVSDGGLNYCRIKTSELAPNHLRCLKGYALSKPTGFYRCINTTVEGDWLNPSRACSEDSWNGIDGQCYRYRKTTPIWDCSAGKLTEGASGSMMCNHKTPTVHNAIRCPTGYHLDNISRKCFRIVRGTEHQRCPSGAKLTNPDALGTKEDSHMLAQKGSSVCVQLVTTEAAYTCGGHDIVLDVDVDSNRNDTSCTYSSRSEPILTCPRISKDSIPTSWDIDDANVVNVSVGAQSLDTGECLYALEMIREPAVEPITQEPAVEPATQQPAVEPATEEPAVEPITQQPAVEPVFVIDFTDKVEKVTAFVIDFTSA